MVGTVGVARNVLRRLEPLRLRPLLQPALGIFVLVVEQDIFSGFLQQRMHKGIHRVDAGIQINGTNHRFEGITKQR